MANSRLALGAIPQADGTTRFRVWAPDHERVEVAAEGQRGLTSFPLERRPAGYFEGSAPVGAGVRYRYCLDGGDCLPDPCSRFQPEGPHGPSEIVDARGHAWTDSAWRGLRAKGQVLYELHVGAFTPEGTFAGAEVKLPHLAELGVTCIELMPVATFPGRFNWGYDGVDLFAPCAAYGRPDDLRRLVDAAHRSGLGVILDVVYNHLGPNGNYLGRFAQAYFTRKYRNEWGEPLNFEGEQGREVRQFFVENARMWISEYHLDGFRFDATQNIYDASTCHVCTEIIREARAAAPGRELLIVAENEPQDVRWISPQHEGGHGGDMVWVDDFHHSMRVALTGNAEAYCRDYRGTSQELVSCALRNSLFQGQWYSWQSKRRGTPLDRPAEQVVFFLQNHDQLANTLRGLRLHSIAGHDLARAATAFWLLLPQTPMLFMGQEFFASTPFLYFVDHEPELQRQVAKGRDAFLSQFETARRALEQGARVPLGEEALSRSRLHWKEREENEGPLLLHKDLLRLRREDPVFAAQDLGRLSGATLSPCALVLRWSGKGLEGAPGDRLLLLNLGADLRFEPCPEPLLAPPAGRTWRVLLSSQHPRYGGIGARAPDGEGRWFIPGQCALVLSSSEASP